MEYQSVNIEDLRNRTEVPEDTQVASKSIGDDFSELFEEFQAAQEFKVGEIVDGRVLSVTKDYVVVDITANAFLHHMVRNIVGSLLAVGSRSSSVEWFETVLQNRDRAQAADTAPAEGLYLVDVSYPEAFGLPETPDGPTLLQGRL